MVTQLICAGVAGSLSDRLLAIRRFEHTFISLKCTSVCQSTVDSKAGCAQAGRGAVLGQRVKISQCSHAVFICLLWSGSHCLGAREVASQSCAQCRLPSPQFLSRNALKKITTWDGGLAGEVGRQGDHQTRSVERPTEMPRPQTYLHALRHLQTGEKGVAIHLLRHTRHPPAALASDVLPPPVHRSLRQVSSQFGGCSTSGHAQKPA